MSRMNQLREQNRRNFRGNVQQRRFCKVSLSPTQGKKMEQRVSPGSYAVDRKRPVGGPVKKKPIGMISLAVQQCEVVPSEYFRALSVVRNQKPREGKRSLWAFSLR